MDNQCSFSSRGLRTSSFQHLQHNPCCIVLDALQLVDGSPRSSVRHRVAVVDPGQDETVDQRLCELRRQQMAHVTEESAVYHCIIDFVADKKHVSHSGNEEASDEELDYDEEDDHAPAFYDKSKSFFDHISCDATTKAQG